MRHFIKYLTVLPFLTLFFGISCHENDLMEEDEPIPELGIMDTLQFNVNLELMNETYNFSPWAGISDRNSDSINTYTTTGSLVYSGGGQITKVDTYTEFKDLDRNVVLKIGFLYPPPNLYMQSYDCTAQTNFANDIITVKQHSLCSSISKYLDGGSEGSNVGQVYFQVEFEDETGTIFRTSSDGYFNITHVEHFPFDGSYGSLTSFDYLVQGDFQSNIKVGDEIYEMKGSNLLFGLWELEQCRED